MNNQSLNPKLTVFVAGAEGLWTIQRNQPSIGPALPMAAKLTVTSAWPPKSGNWALAGVSSNARYLERKEKTSLQAVQAPLGRPEAKCAALIPIKKSDAWWELTQEERRHIFEAESHHIAHSLKYLPAIARHLYHCRDLGGEFDFLTWFEFAPGESDRFEELVDNLRSTEEWKYVVREVDIRLIYSGSSLK